VAYINNVYSREVYLPNVTYVTPVVNIMKLTAYFCKFPRYSRVYYYTPFQNLNFMSLPTRRFAHRVYCTDSGVAKCLAPRASYQNGRP